MSLLPKLVISRVIPEPAMQVAASRFDLVVKPDGQDMTLDETIAALAGSQAAAMIFANNIVLDRGALARLPPTLRIAASCSVGYDHVDVTAANDARLTVTNTPDVLTECTADFTMLLLLNAARRGREYLDVCRAGWPYRFGAAEALGVSLSGKVLAIAGLGRIGRAVARRAAGFGMTVHYWDKGRLPVELEAGARFFADSDEMLATADFLTLHLSADPAAPPWLDGRRLGLLPKGAVVVNAARGPLIDEAALLAALGDGHLFAAGLDVFQHEPGGNAALIAAPNVFATPHMASATLETRTAMALRALSNVEAVLATGKALDPVTQ